MKHYYGLWVMALFVLMTTSCITASIRPNDPPINDPDGPGQLGAVLGTVVDNSSGLSIWSGEAKIGEQTAVVEDGKFHFPELVPGLYSLSVKVEFYRDYGAYVHVKQGSNVVEVRMNSIFSQSDLDLFARLVHAEARGEIYRGQVAVAASVLNRVRHFNYPNTLRGVILHRVNGRAQYSPVDDGSINLAANQSAIGAVQDALAGWDPSLGSTGFFAPAKVLNRNNWVWQQIPIIDIGNHRFFRAHLD